MTWQNGDGGNNNGADTYYALSTDLKSWTFKGALFARNDNQFQTNANVKLLSDGRLMAVSSFWDTGSYRLAGVDKNDALPTDAAGVAANKQHGIRVRFSSDNGASWTSSQIIYNGPNWECHIMEPSAGHIQIYFAESRPRISDSHSGTSMIESYDNGKTWTPGLGNKPYRVMRKLWTDASNRGGIQNKFTYQMPVGVILNGSSQMAFALETVEGSIGNLDHKIAVVYSPSNGVWDHLEGSEVTPMADRLDDIASGIGPCLVQFPSGETALLLTTRGKIYTKLGDEKAHNWSETSLRPIFPDWAGWPGAEIETSHTMLATTVQRPKGWQKTIGLVKLALNHDICATPRKVRMNGRNREWKKTDDALFLGEFSDAWATIRASQDKDNLYFLVEVSDTCMTSSDNVSLMLAGTGTSSAEALTVNISADGLLIAERSGIEVTGVRSSMSSEGTLDSDGGDDKGWVAEISVPRELLQIADSQIALNAVLYDAAAGREDFLSEPLEDGSTANWKLVMGL